MHGWEHGQCLLTGNDPGRLRPTSSILSKYWNYLKGILYVIIVRSTCHWLCQHCGPDCQGFRSFFFSYLQLQSLNLQYTPEIFFNLNIVKSFLLYNHSIVLTGNFVNCPAILIILFTILIQL